MGVSDGANPTNGLRLYLNGFWTLVNTAPVSLTNTAHEVSIGAREANATSGYTLPFSGLIDDVRIYNRALTPADVQTLFAQADSVILSIQRNGNTVTLSWPVTGTTFVPQSADVLLSTGIVWTDVPGTPIVNGSTVSITLNVDAAMKFYRLRSAN